MIIAYHDSGARLRKTETIAKRRIRAVKLYATIVKVAVDGALSQLEKSGQYSRGSYSTGAQSMGSQPTLVAPAMRKFCANCGTALPGGTAKCPSCGANI